MKRKGEKNYTPYVRLEWRLIDCMAFKVLSPAAVWLLVMLLRQFNAKEGGYSHIVLPFRQIQWKLCWRTFERARRELVVGGFIKVESEGGFEGKGGLFRIPAVYSLANGVEARCAALAKDETAGRSVWVRRGDKKCLEWYPFKKGSPESARNLERARAKLAEGALYQKRPRQNTHHISLHRTGKGKKG